MGRTKATEDNWPKYRSKFINMCQFEGLEGCFWRANGHSKRVCMGSEAFVTAGKAALGVKREGRGVISGDESCELREFPAAYNCIFEHENAVLRQIILKILYILSKLPFNPHILSINQI